MEEKKHPQRAIITGVTSGIGKATATTLVKGGFRVLGVGRQRDALEGLRKELGDGFQFLTADLGQSAQREDLLRALEEEPPADVLVNNAAGCIYQSPLSLDSDMFHQLLTVNVLAAAELCRAVCNRMERGGRVIQVSSVTAKFCPAPAFGPYAATKAALESLSESLRMELSKKGISVCVVRPGLVDTPIYEKVPDFRPILDKLKNQIPEPLRPQDIADVILWLLETPPRVTVTELSVLPQGQVR